MPLEKLCAAGLKGQPAAPRIIRSIYYKDYLSVDVIIAIIGVMLALLFLGMCVSYLNTQTLETPKKESRELLIESAFKKESHLPKSTKFKFL